MSNILCHVAALGCQDGLQRHVVKRLDQEAVRWARASKRQKHLIPTVGVMCMVWCGKWSIRDFRRGVARLAIETNGPPAWRALRHRAIPALRISHCSTGRWLARRIQVVTELERQAVPCCMAEKSMQGTRIPSCLPVYRCLKSCVNVAPSSAHGQDMP